MIDVTSSRVCVVGLGTVGEALAIAFAQHFVVVGYDISEERVNGLRQRHQGMHLHTSPDDMERCDLIAICVPTPLNENGEINLQFVEAACETVVSKARAGCCVVLESTVAVGMTRKLLGHVRELGIYVGYSPERIDPGRQNPSPHDIAKVIAGIDDESLEKIQSIYANVFRKLVPVNSLEVAEMSKLYENCFRVSPNAACSPSTQSNEHPIAMQLINIAYVNEIADACELHGIDIDEVVEASSTKPFGFMAFKAGLGAGGPCIPVNPYYLLHNSNLPLLRSAACAMEQRPVKKAIQLVEENPNAETYLVVGLAYKPGQSLTTHSPAITFVDALMAQVRGSFVNLMLRYLTSRTRVLPILQGKDVTVFDPHVNPEIDEYKNLEPEDWSPILIDSKFDIVCVTCLHEGVQCLLRQLNKAKVVIY